MLLLVLDPLKVIFLLYSHLKHKNRLNLAISEPHREVSHDAVIDFCALWNLPRCSMTSGTDDWRNQNRVYTQPRDEFLLAIGVAAALEDAASAEEPFVRVCREVLGKRSGGSGGGGRKRKPSAKIFESLNKMLGQIVLQKQPL